MRYSNLSSVSCSKLKSRHLMLKLSKIYETHASIAILILVSTIKVNWAHNHNAFFSYLLDRSNIWRYETKKFLKCENCIAWSSVFIYFYCWVASLNLCSNTRDACDLNHDLWGVWNKLSLSRLFTPLNGPAFKLLACPIWEPLAVDVLLAFLFLEHTDGSYFCHLIDL